MPADIAFVEPCFPQAQREFVRALHGVGANVIGIGERPRQTLDEDLRRWLTHYEQVRNVTNPDEVEGALRVIQMKGVKVQRLEAVVEAHVLCAATVRERLGIPGTSLRTTFLCRDKPAMKDALRAAGVPCAESIGSANADELRAFVQRVGFPVVFKPRDGSGATGTARVNDPAELEAALMSFGVDRGRSVAVEEFIDGHEGFYDTLTVNGQVIHEFAAHCYPNVLEAMRTRWISPQFITTNRMDGPGYEDLKALGRRVIEVLGIGTSATHMEWFFGPKGLRFSEIGVRPPGVRAWDLHAIANDFDIHREWAMAVVHGRPSQTLSRQYSAGFVAFRPEFDGRIAGYDGVEEVHWQFGRNLIDEYLPPPGTATRPVEAGYMANAWMRFKHQDYDALRGLLDAVSRTIRVRSRNS